jgi:hypothetical protein
MSGLQLFIDFITSYTSIRREVGLLGNILIEFGIFSELVGLINYVYCVWYLVQFV